MQPVAPLTMLLTPVVPNMNITALFAIARPAPTADIPIKHNPANIVAKFHTQVYNATIAIRRITIVRPDIRAALAAPVTRKPAQHLKNAKIAAQLQAPATSANRMKFTGLMYTILIVFL